MNTKTYWCDTCFSDSVTPKLCSKCGAELIDYDHVLSEAKFVSPSYGQFTIDFRDDTEIKELLEKSLVKCSEQYFQKYHRAVDNGRLLIICNDIAAEKFSNYVYEQLERVGISKITLEFVKFPKDEKFVKDKIEWIQGINGRE